jgi:hypothetical protein
MEQVHLGNPDANNPQRYVLMLKREKRLVFRSTLGWHAKAVASFLKTPFCTALCYTDYFTG